MAPFKCERVAPEAERDPHDLDKASRLYESFVAGPQGRCQRGAQLQPAEHWIEIVSARHLSGSKWVGQGRCLATWRGEFLGEFRIPECDAARWLIENGHAAPGDTLVLCWNGRPTLVGSVGWFADRTVLENENAGPRWARFKPFDLSPLDAPETARGVDQEAQVDSAATLGPKALGEAP
jgi:hypothetical protein